MLQIHEDSVESADNGKPTYQDPIHPRVKAFLLSEGFHLVRESSWKLHHTLRGRQLHLTDGHTLDILYHVLIFTDLPLPLPTGHDHPEVAEFVRRAAQAIKVYERYEGSAQEKHDNLVQGMVLTELWKQFTSRTDAGSRVPVRDLKIQAEAKLESEFQAQMQERLSGVCAGQETLRGKGATDVTPQNAVTCEDSAPLKTPEEILKKVHDEGHEHRLSRDWDKLPAGSYKVFKVIGEKIAEGNATKRDAVFLARLDPSGKIRAALLASKYLLSVDAENNLQVMPDRAVYVDTEWAVHNGVKVNMAKYPGIAEGTNPLVGSNHKAEELDSQVMMATLLLTKDGHGPSRRAVAHYLNERLPSGKKAVSEDMVRASTKRLVGSRRLVMVKLPQYHRLDHAWTATPAVYGRAEDHPALAMRKISLKDGRTVRLGEELACAA